MHSRDHHPLFIFLLAASLILAGCGRQPAEVEGDVFVVADLFATPGKALATVELSPTPSPTATIPSVPTASPAPTLPLPTVVVLQQPTLPIGTSSGPGPTSAGGVTVTPAITTTPPTCATAPDLPFTPIWQNISRAQFLMGCPVGNVESVAGVFQFFEHGFMFWRESDRSIFVLSELAIRGGQDTDSWWRLADTFTEGEPESDPGLQPPAGLIEPLRGFGKVWRNNAFLREAVGWATTEEIGGAALWQTFDGGWMMTGPNGVPIYVLVPLDAANTSGTHLGALPR